MLKTIKDLFTKYRELILYLFFGGCTTLVNIVSYFVLTDLLGIDFLVSNAIAWVLSVLFAYVTNRIWVFKSAAAGFVPVVKEMASFFGFRLLSGGLDMLIMYVGVSVMALPDEWIKIFANVLVILLNYVFSKLFIFKKKDNTQSQPES